MAQHDTVVHSRSRQTPVAVSTLHLHLAAFASGHCGHCELVPPIDAGITSPFPVGDSNTTL
jgi:hypothetical protein